MKMVTLQIFLTFVTVCFSVHFVTGDENDEIFGLPMQEEFVPEHFEEQLTSPLVPYIPQVNNTNKISYLAQDLPIVGRAARTLPPDCSISSTSPKFSQLCNLPEGPDSPLTDFLDLSANHLCDADCRCVHGATARGGRCGVPKGKSQSFCVCDYKQEPARAQLLSSGFEEVDECEVIGTLVTPICSITSPLLKPMIGELCDIDCQCGHGHDNTADHICTIENNQAGNQTPFCVCGGAKSLPKRRNFHRGFNA